MKSNNDWGSPKVVLPKNGSSSPLPAASPENVSPAPWSPQRHQQQQGSNGGQERSPRSNASTPNPMDQEFLEEEQRDAWMYRTPSPTFSENDAGILKEEISGRRAPSATDEAIQNNSQSLELFNEPRNGVLSTTSPSPIPQEPVDMEISNSPPESPVSHRAEDSLLAFKEAKDGTPVTMAPPLNLQEPATEPMKPAERLLPPPPPPPPRPRPRPTASSVFSTSTDILALESLESEARPPPPSSPPRRPPPPPPRPRPRPSALTSPPPALPTASLPLGSTTAETQGVFNLPKNATAATMSPSLCLQEPEDMDISTSPAESPAYFSTPRDSRALESLESEVRPPPRTSPPRRPPPPPPRPRPTIPTLPPPPPPTAFPPLSSTNTGTHTSEAVYGTFEQTSSSSSPLASLLFLMPQSIPQRGVSALAAALLLNISTSSSLENRSPPPASSSTEASTSSTFRKNKSKNKEVNQSLMPSSSGSLISSSAYNPPYSMPYQNPPDGHSLHLRLRTPTFVQNFQGSRGQEQASSSAAPSKPQNPSATSGTAESKLKMALESSFSKIIFERLLTEARGREGFLSEERKAQLWITARKEGLQQLEDVRRQEEEKKRRKFDQEVAEKKAVAEKFAEEVIRAHQIEVLKDWYVTLLENGYTFDASVKPSFFSAKKEPPSSHQRSRSTSSVRTFPDSLYNEQLDEEWNTMHEEPPSRRRSSIGRQPSREERGRSGSKSPHRSRRSSHRSRRSPVLRSRRRRQAEMATSRSRSPMDRRQRASTPVNPDHPDLPATYARTASRTSPRTSRWRRHSFSPSPYPRNVEVQGPSAASAASSEHDLSEEACSTAPRMAVASSHLTPSPSTSATSPDPLLLSPPSGCPTDICAPSSSSSSTLTSLGNPRVSSGSSRTVVHLRSPSPSRNLESPPPLPPRDTRPIRRGPRTPPLPVNANFSPMALTNSPGFETAEGNGRLRDPIRREFGRRDIENSEDLRVNPGVYGEVHVLRQQGTPNNPPDCSEMPVEHMHPNERQEHTHPYWIPDLEPISIPRPTSTQENEVNNTSTSSYGSQKKPVKRGFFFVR